MKSWQDERSAHERWQQPAPVSSIWWWLLAMSLACFGLAVLMWQVEQNQQRYAAEQQQAQVREQALQAALQQARLGDKVAQYQVGLYYMRQGDERSAVYWYEQSAAQGYAKAMNNWAVLLLEGRDTPRDVARACALFEQAAQVLRDAKSAENVQMCHDELRKQR